MPVESQVRAGGNWQFVSLQNKTYKHLNENKTKKKFG